MSRARYPGPVMNFAPRAADWLAHLGLAGLALLFCLRHYTRALAGREPLDLPALAAALRHDGLGMWPAMTLTATLLGAILGQQSLALLARIDLPGLILPTLDRAIVLELIPLLVGILIAGRAGVALAVRQATLAMTGEQDGLRVCGIEPIVFTAGPALLAMLLTAFVFAVWGSLITLGVAQAWLASRVPLALLVDALRQALTPAELTRALLVKPLLFALAAALIATVNGMLASRDRLGVERAATATMIGAMSAMLGIDLALLLWR